MKLGFFKIIIIIVIIASLYNSYTLDSYSAENITGYNKIYYNTGVDYINRAGNHIKTITYKNTNSYPVTLTKKNILMNCYSKTTLKNEVINDIYMKVSFKTGDKQSTSSLTLGKNEVAYINILPKYYGTGVNEEVTCDYQINIDVQ